MSITQTENKTDAVLVDVVARTRRNVYRVEGVHPSWVIRFRSMAADRVAAILEATGPVIVVPA